MQTFQPSANNCIQGLSPLSQHDAITVESMGRPLVDLSLVSSACLHPGRGVTNPQGPCMAQSGQTHGRGGKATSQI